MFGHDTFSYVLLVRKENNLVLACSIWSDITHFICNISSDTRHHIFVSNMGSDITHFIFFGIRTPDIIFSCVTLVRTYYIFVCNVSSERKNSTYVQALHIVVFCISSDRK